MHFIDDLTRAWVSVSLPGVGNSSRPKSTYQAFDRIPPVPAEVDRFDWLLHAEAWPGSTLAEPSASAIADLSLATIASRVGDDTPADLIRFTSNPEFRQRLLSVTDAYFDLGDEVATVEGGRLLHLVSDSQWVMHWSVYVGDDGRTAIVASEFAFGFHLGEDDLQSWANSGKTFLCADSFAEFAWRWWMDNELFFGAVVDKRALTPAQQTYLAEYGEPTPFD